MKKLKNLYKTTKALFKGLRVMGMNESRVMARGWQLSPSEQRRFEMAMLDIKAGTVAVLVCALLWIGFINSPFSAEKMQP